MIKRIKDRPFGGKSNRERDNWTPFRSFMQRDNYRSAFPYQLGRHGMGRVLEAAEEFDDVDEE